MDDFDEDFGDFDLDYSMPKYVSYDISALSEFCNKDPDCVLTFYGGEPLLASETIQQIMDTVKAKYFMIQTNGVFLDQLPSNYVNRFHTILVSVDGDEDLTDSNRGKGTYRKVINNLNLVVANGFNGELIARMTVNEQTDIYKQVLWLLNNDDFSFSSIHWQLNAGFWGNDFERRDFRSWTEKNYIPNVSKLVDFWVDQIENENKVIKLYPLLGIANSFLFEKKNNLLRCGGGWINYAIQTDGQIIPCPTMWGMKKYYLGNVAETDPLKIQKILIREKPCSNCEILNLCGGRCLYANITKRWNDEAYRIVCKTVKSLIELVQSKMPRIRKCIANRRVSLSDFEFLEYNGCEIIP